MDPRKEKLETKGSDKDMEALISAKEEEKVFQNKRNKKKKLYRVPLLNGYALTTEPEKYKEKSGSIYHI